MRAQLPVSTGANAASGADSRWLVSYANLGIPAGTAFAAAQIVASPPGAWQSNTSDYRWISPRADASVRGGLAVYTFRLQFDLTGYDPASASLSFRYAVNNDDRGYSLNGGVTGFGAGSDSKFGAQQTLSSGFQAGVNTLDVRVRGDGTADGLLLEVQDFQVSPTATVPEPATVALTGAGLAATGLAARRRRRRQA